MSFQRAEVHSAQPYQVIGTPASAKSASRAPDARGYHALTSHSQERTPAPVLAKQVEPVKGRKHASARDKYRPDIDGMRAIAVLLVLVFHFALFPRAIAGFIGVDIFFVISGYLITSIIVNGLDNQSFSLSRFYTHRIRRLAPALFVVLAFVTLAGLLWLFPEQLNELEKQVVVSQFYLANVYFWRNINYFGLGAHDVYLLHMWSLAVEEQFYLFYPAALFLICQIYRKHLGKILFVCLLISFGLNVVAVGWKPDAVFYLFPTRAWELLAGAMVVFVGRSWPRSLRVDEVLGWVGLACVAIGALSFQRGFHFPGAFALWPVVGAVCLILAGQNNSTSVSTLLSWRPVVYIGAISYPLYLVHWPISVFSEILNGNLDVRWRLVLFGLSIALAAIIYHAVERPLRYGPLFRSNKRLICGYGAGLAITLSMFLAVQLTNGLPRRFPAAVVRLANYVNDKSPPLTQCGFNGHALTLACRIGAEGRTPTWLVYGDSHAWAAYTAFDKWLQSRDEAGFFAYMHQCPPLIGLYLVGDNGDCFRFNQQVAQLIDKNPSIRNIALVSIWRQAIEALLSTSADVVPTKQESLKAFSSQFAQTVQAFSEAGRGVYIWEPVPGARASVPMGLARAAWQGRPAEIEISLAEYRSTYQFFFEALKNNDKWVSGVFSPADVLCKTGKCIVELNGEPLYADDNHITLSMSDVWVNVLNRVSAPP
jgi:peptidoglycan/LPS O-acetylase OafA/YrhL